MIEVKNLSLEIDSNLIIKDINFKIEKGQIVGLVGPNGMGKTSLIKCLTGIYENTSGEILYNNKKVFDNEECKSNIAYVADENQFFSSFKIKDVITYYDLAYKNLDYKKLENINKIFQINLNKRVFQLSKGQRMRVSILIALCLQTEFLILDEPTSGLDPIIKNALLKLLVREKENGRTVLVSSHHLIELEKICDSIIFIKGGMVTNHSTLDQLREKVKKLQVVFDAPTYEEDFSMEGIIKLQKIGRVFTIVTNSYSDDFVEKINKLNPLFIEEVPLNLEDIFIHEIGGEDLYEEVIK